MTAIRDQLLALAQDAEKFANIARSNQVGGKEEMACAAIAHTHEYWQKKLTAFADQLQGDGLGEDDRIYFCSECQRFYGDSNQDCANRHTVVGTPSKPEPAAEPAQADDLKPAFGDASYQGAIEAVRKAQREKTLAQQKPSPPRDVPAGSLCKNEELSTGNSVQKVQSVNQHGAPSNPPTPYDLSHPATNERGVQCDVPAEPTTNSSAIDSSLVVPAEQGIDLEQFEGHTPGPWELVHNSWETSGVYAGAGTKVVAECPIDNYVDEDTQDLYEREKEANGRLIAAAPQLLAELRRLRAAQNEPCNWVELRNQKDKEFKGNKS